MKQWQKTTLVICSLLGMGVSFAYHLYQNRNDLYEILAPVHVNIEIDKEYSHFVSVIATINNFKNTSFDLSAEETDSSLRQVVLYREIKSEDVKMPPFINALLLRMPKEAADETLKAIDEISIFIGNKLFYFSRSDVINFRGKEQDGYILYGLQGLEYKKSLIMTALKRPSWINWYGDFNMAVETVLFFLSRPEKFIITWGFLVFFLILCRSNIENIYSALKKRKVPSELLLLGFIVIAGFILRLNGYVRHSSWLDEIGSACIASNPDLPFLSAFEDPGNPPFYFILLRFWFMAFGWTEQSGRLFSVILGTAAIVSLYTMLKQRAGKKIAFLAAAYMAVSAYLIGFSQEMRPYILEVFLVSIVAHRFMIILQGQQLNLANMIWYIVPSVFLVNTHYYGGLFIFVNFLYFVSYAIRTKTFILKKTVLFFTGNVIIALSLLPYFIHTALRAALFDHDFNNWISKPGFAFKCIAVFIPLFGVIYAALRKTIFPKILHGLRYCFLDYTIFVTAFVYLMAFGISLYRPILVPRYLSILLPLLIAIIAIIIINIYINSSKFLGSLCIVFAFVWIAGGYNSEHGGSTDVYQETLAYIFRDAESHPKNTSVGIDVFQDHQDYSENLAKFYGYRHLPLYTPGDTYDVLYINPIYWTESQMYAEIANLGIDLEKALKIRVNRTRSIFKIYP